MSIAGTRTGNQYESERNTMAQQQIEQLREKVLRANLSLDEKKLVISTWGNVSGYDPELGLVAIKASGIHYDEMKAEHITVLDLEGNVVLGDFIPSTDTATHLILYRSFKAHGICGIVHTHSQYATMWAQAGREIPCLGTTHADYFYGAVPCTRELTEEEIYSHYEESTGHSILEVMEGRSCREMQAVLAKYHAPFVWGVSPEAAVTNSMVLEYVAKMAYMENMLTRMECKPLPQSMLQKHYNRKFGKNAYYGQYKRERKKA